MLEEEINILPVDKLAGIVGGRYRLVTLINRRLRQIINGALPLVPYKSGERMIETIAREIETGKIWLEMPEEDATTNRREEFRDLFDMDE